MILHFFSSSSFFNWNLKKATITEELQTVKQRLLVEEKQRKTVENELVKLKKAVPENENDFEVIWFCILEYVFLNI